MEVGSKQRYEAADLLTTASVVALPLDEIGYWLPDKSVPDGKQPYLLRGLSFFLYPDQRHWSYVWRNRETREVWVQHGINRPEMILPGMVWVVEELPVIAFLDDNPTKVFCTAHLGGDDFWQKPSKRIAFIAAREDNLTFGERVTRLIVILAFFGIPGTVGALLARRKGRSAVGWFFLSALFWLPVLIVLLLPPVKERGTTRMGTA